MSESQIPLSEWLARSGGTVALVFSDVVDSTLLLNARKTVRYSSILRAHRTRASERIGAHGGRLIDGPVGDQLLAAFPSARSACAYASELFGDPGADLRVRIGVHVGAVTAEGSTLVGRQVHLGARVMQHAKDAEFWVSDSAKTALEAESAGETPELRWLRSERCELRGVPERQRLWRVG